MILLTGGGVSGPKGGCLVQGGAAPRGGVCSRGMSAPGGAWWRLPRTATAAGGTHPTGMHSYLYLVLQIQRPMKIQWERRARTMHVKR